MSIFSYNNFKQLCIIMVAAIVAQAVVAQNYNDSQTMTLNEAIRTPIVKENKCHNAIANYQTNQARILSEDRDLNVMLTRNQEVIIITITADQLFAPNSNVLMRNADNVLNQYAKFLRTPDYYRMAIAMYHDNNGSESYCKKVTDERIQSIYDWFVLNANAQYVIPFSFGSHDPVVKNNSIQNRRLNRRLEIYLIPGNTMIDQAKRNLLR